MGVANARNAVLRAARGDLLLCTDDDVLIDEEWLVAYVSAFRRWPNAGDCCGPISAPYEQEPPPWYRANEARLRGFAGERAPFGDAERALGLLEPAWGANMAFRRAAYTTTRFRSDIGRRGARARLLGGSALLRAS